MSFETILVFDEHAFTTALLHQMALHPCCLFRKLLLDNVLDVVYWVGVMLCGYRFFRLPRGECYGVNRNCSSSLLHLLIRQRVHHIPML